jgi:hypothetical protein
MKDESNTPKMKSLFITNNYKGELSGQLEFRTDHGEIKFQLNNEQAARIISNVADIVVEDARLVSQLLIKDVETAMLLEAPKEEGVEGEVV